MDTVVTILGSITETSMPFNEFVIYRASSNLNEKHLVIVCNEKKELPKINIPSNVKIEYIGKNIFKIRKYLKKLIKNFEISKTKYVFHLHQLHSAFLSHIAMLGTKFHKKTLYTIHSTFTGYAFYNKILCFISALLSEIVVCVSKTSYDNFPNILKKLKKEKICVIRNGVDTDRIDTVIKTKKIQKNDCVRFVYIARIIPIKNHEFLISVLKQIKKNVKFVFIGDGCQKSKLQSICEENNLSNKVEFTGLLPRNEVYDKLNTCDVYFSSSTLEGMPISVLEAGYIGLPLILSNIPQHVELANQEENIVLLSLNVEDWVKIINKFADMSEKERLKIGKKCKKYIFENFSLQRMHDKYEKIYVKLS